MTRAVEPIFWTNRPATDRREAPALASLDNIGLKFHSDKASSHHGFLGFYERFLTEIRHSATSVLEIGVNGGESLRMWEEFFPAARVFGLDHREECLSLAGGRRNVAIAGPADVMAWVDIAARHGPFDLVIDDGTHLWEHQIAAFRAFYPFVRPGGFYILEDIDTSYGDYVEMFRGDARMSAASYLHSLSDLLVGDASLDPAVIDDAFLKSAARRTEFLAWHRRAALLRRAPA